MPIPSSDTILLKLNQLPGHARREVDDFVDFLLSRRPKTVKPRTKARPDYQPYFGILKSQNDGIYPIRQRA